jgi:uncharacterized phage protein (TIGR01671 family)
MLKMNREIKFRVWDTENRRFLQHGSFCLFPDDNEVWEVRLLKNYGELEYIPHAVVQQYTGLKDSKGVDIYEGDIVKIEDKEEVRIYDIVFSHGYFGLNRGSKFKHALMCPYTEIIEIIGNIFENPELL